MMLPAAGAVGPQAEDHVGTNHPNQPDEVADDLVAAPLLERLFDAEREAEVDGAGEVLLRAVEAVERGELLGPQHAERLEDLRADLVLAAVAAGRRRQRGAIALPAVQHHQQAVVLVVGMGGGLMKMPVLPRCRSARPERDVALVVVERDDAHLRARRQA